MKACGKIILTGEHAVVYGKPGIALPLKRFYTMAVLSGAESFSFSTDRELSDDESLKMKQVFDLLFEKLSIDKNIHVEIESNIPSGGLGSSASLSVALAKAFLNHAGQSFEKVNELAFELEKIFHGSPSGIDNTVVAYEQPVYFKNMNVELLEIKPIYLVIANTGRKSNTKEAVELVRQKKEEEPEKYNKIFDDIEEIVDESRQCLETGDMKKLGSLLTKNHELLKEIGVSNPELDRLVGISLKAGALGAKLAGAGMGGNIIALVDRREKVESALKEYAKDVYFVVV
jgi:mevalonate kinase